MNVNGYILATSSGGERGPFNPLEVERGTAVRIACQVDANPPIQNPWWRRDGNQVLQQNSFNLTFGDGALTAEQAGPFACFGANDIGESFAELTVRVFYAPQVRVEPPLQTVKEGESAKLRCQVDSAPDPDGEAIEWLVRCFLFFNIARDGAVGNWMSRVQLGTSESVMLSESTKCLEFPSVSD